MLSSKHPSVDELVAFSVGQLSIIDAEVVEGHIGACEPYCQTLLGLSSDDTFVGLLQEADGYKESPTMNLSTLVKQNGPLTISKACDYARQIAVGLQYAHEQGC